MATGVNLVQAGCLEPPPQGVSKAFFGVCDMNLLPVISICSISSTATVLHWNVPGGSLAGSVPE